jgi:glycosyltransferase involved in cell wall biosynthesis
MNSRTGVTIAIPNWNHEILLPRAIASGLRALTALKERGMPGEVVVLDDASRDGSLTLLRRLEALYYNDGLRLLAFASNGGLAANRNAMLAGARYRYVTFLDADNELVPENLPYFVETLVATKAAVAYGNLLLRSAASECAYNVLSAESVQHKLFRGNYIDAFALLDRLQLLDAGGYDTSYQALEDWEMWIHLATNGRQIVFVPMVYGYYYALPGSMALDPAKEQASHNKIRRVFNQVKVRELLAMNTDRLRYHPELGRI